MPTSGGSAKKVFFEIDDAFRVTLAAQVEEVGSYFARSFSAFPFLPAVAVVKLHPDALAKSHRPDSLFRGTGCNIIGSRHSGELLIAVKDRSLSLLGEAIRKLQTKTAIANMSTITEIIPYTSRDALQTKVPESGKAVTVKLKPFLHYSGRENAALSEHMDTVFKSLRCSYVTRLNCYGRSTVLRLERLEAEQVIGLASFVGTRSLAEFPIYRALRMSSRRLGPATPGSFTPPDDASEYPVLGIVDSGVDPGSSLMSPWIAARMCSVAEADCDYSHGTFVGALAIQPRILNNLNPCFPAAPCKILDVVVFPRSGELPENELLQAIDDALRAYPDVRVWNLSLSSNIPCSDSGFSDLAMALDELQDEFDVTFVIAAGNYTKPPFRGWPAENLGEDDRIGSPGDSARGITVGSLAHLESPTSRVRRDHPSPFSRRGPGAAFHPKPELTHYAGNCDTVGNCIQTGVVSLDGSDYLVEDVGTSYAVPLVASSLATIHSLTAERLSTNLGKALLIHSAVLGRKIAKESERAYYGFGVPDAVERVLTCTGSSVTLVFEPELRGSTSFEKSPFPFPTVSSTHQRPDLRRHHDYSRL